MVLGTQVKVFDTENEGSTLVTTTSDTAHPDRPAHVGYEQCENDAEAQAVLQKWVFDLQRQGWQIQE